MKIYKDELETSLRFLIVPEKALSNFTALILVGAGSRFEEEHTVGISHFLEHMFFKGTEKRPSTFVLSSELDQIGAEYNAFTGKEYTGYYIKAAPEHLDLALDILSDMYFNSRLEEKEIQKERGVIAEEMNLYQDTPLHYVSDLFEKILFKGEPLGRFIIGTKKSLININRQELVSYLSSRYISSNTVVCLAGNIDIKKAKTKIEKYFSHSKRDGKTTFNKSSYSQKKPQALVHYKQTDQTHFIVGVRAYSTGDEKRFASQILATILGGNMSSRLFIKIREQLGLAYYIKTESDNYLDTGVLATQAGVPNNEAERAIKLILQEYKDIKEKGVSDKELKKAKNYLKGKLAVSLDETQEIAEWVSLQEVLKSEILTPEQIYGKIDIVGKRDIQKIATEIFQENQLNLAIIGPFKEKEKFQKILRF